MIRRVMLLILTAIVLVTLSGCMGGGPGIDTAAITTAIGRVIDGFEADIEAYDIDETDGALSCLSGTGFKLTLEEAGASYDKTYATLKQELEDDEENQLYWRTNNGYRLDLRLGTRVFSNVSATGAVVTQRYSVAEWATRIPVVVTDQGSITWQFANVSGAWKATAMWITFEPVQTRAAGIRAGGAAPTGFGFGVGLNGL
ncbi:MAG: hypothetical protein AB1774_06070 [Bacillota bacterium]